MGYFEDSKTGEESTAASSVSSVPSDRESSEKDTAEYSSVVSPYQDKPLAGEES